MTEINADDPYESPCVRRCVIDADTNRCFGCARTLDEICYWTRYTADERRAILAQLPVRLTEFKRNETRK